MMKIEIPNNVAEFEVQMNGVKIVLKAFADGFNKGVQVEPIDSRQSVVSQGQVQVVRFLQRIG